MKNDDITTRRQWVVGPRQQMSLSYSWYIAPLLKRSCNHGFYWFTSKIPDDLVSVTAPLS